MASPPGRGTAIKFPSKTQYLGDNRDKAGASLCAIEHANAPIGAGLRRPRSRTLIGDRYGKQAGAFAVVAGVRKESTPLDDQVD